MISLRLTLTALLALVAAVAAPELVSAQSVASPVPSVVPSPAASASPASSTPTAPTPGKSGAPVGPSPSPSPSPSPTPPPHIFVLSAYGDAGYTAVGNTNAVRFVNGTPSRVFDGSTGPFFDANSNKQLAPANDLNNSFDLQNANVQLTINGPVIGGKIEGSFGSDADVIASNGQSRSGSNLTQAYLAFVQGPVTLTAGKFETLAGAEVLEATGNSNYSRSYLFGYAIPFTHTGARLTYAYGSKVSLVGGVNDGWDDWKFSSKKKTLEGGILLTPSPGYALTLDTYNGNDFEANGGPGGVAPTYTNRMLYDGVLTLHPTSALTLIANYDNGTQLGSGVAGATASHWNGLAGYLNYALNSRFGVSLRKETFHDIAGFRTGIPQRLQSNTATLNYTPVGNITVRAEYRIDASDGNNFTFSNAGTSPGLLPNTTVPNGRGHQNSFGFETILKTP